MNSSERQLSETALEELEMNKKQYSANADLWAETMLMERKFWASGITAKGEVWPATRQELGKAEVLFSGEYVECRHLFLIFFEMELKSVHAEQKNWRPFLSCWKL